MAEIKRVNTIGTSRDLLTNKVKRRMIWHTEEPEPDRRILAIIAEDRAVVYYVYRNHWNGIKRDVVQWCYIDDLLKIK